jgi:hypothetical protein
MKLSGTCIGKKGRLVSSLHVTAFVILTGFFLSACASMTGQTVGTMAVTKGEVSPITQTLDSSGFKLKMPSNWEAVALTQEEKDGHIVGKFTDPKRGVSIAVTKLGLTPLSGQRGFLDNIAESVLPNYAITEGPYALGATALSPFYIRYSGSLMAEGQMIPMDILGSYNLSRGFGTYIIYMVTARINIARARADFLAVVENFNL